MFSSSTVICHVSLHLFWFPRPQAATANNTPSSKGVSSVDAVSNSNGRGTPPADPVDLPKLKGIGRNRRARFSLYRHLHKHNIQHADSVSSVDSAGLFIGLLSPPQGSSFLDSLMFL